MINAGFNLDAHEYSSERNASTYLIKDDLSKRVCNLVMASDLLLLIWNIPSSLKYYLQITERYCQLFRRRVLEKFATAFLV